MIPSVVYRTVLCVVLVLGCLGVTAEGPQPDAVPLCASPQAIAPFTRYVWTSYEDSRAAVAWNGREYAIAYSDGSIYFRRFYPDGTPAGDRVNIASVGTTGNTHDVAIAWTSPYFAIAYRTVSQVYLVLVDSNGVIGYGPTAASTSTITPNHVALAAADDGWGYLVVWSDARSGNADIYATQFDWIGAIGNGGANHDLVVCSAANAQTYPTVAWTPSMQYSIVWQDYRSGTKNELYTRVMYSAGSFGTESSLVSSAGSALHPRIAGANGPFGVTWSDNRDGNAEVYFCRLNPSGAKVGSDVRVTSTSSSSYRPNLAFTGGEWALFYADNASGSYDIWYQRMSLTGTLLGSAAPAMTMPGLTLPAAAFATKGFLAIACSSPTSDAGYVQTIGCSAPTSPPCPENALAYNISGTQATLAWLPVVDPYFDIAYYQIYRDNSLVGVTASTFFMDPGLSLGTTYNFAIRTVNASQSVSTGCPTSSSVYVRTNASLLLRVDKASPDATLTWTDTDPLNSYNVFRGTSPQVMQQIGTVDGFAFIDPGVMNDAVTYFYTVDDPGQ